MMRVKINNFNFNFNLFLELPVGWLHNNCWLTIITVEWTSLVPESLKFLEWQLQIQFRVLYVNMPKRIIDSKKRQNFDFEFVTQMCWLKQIWIWRLCSNEWDRRGSSQIDNVKHKEENTNNLKYKLSPLFEHYSLTF